MKATEGIKNIQKTLLLISDHTSIDTIYAHKLLNSLDAHIKYLESLVSFYSNAINNNKKIELVSDMDISARAKNILCAERLYNTIEIEQFLRFYGVSALRKIPTCGSKTTQEILSYMNIKDEHEI